MSYMGSCIAGQADGVKVQIYHNDDCADEPQFYPVATDSCLGGNMKVRCNAAGEASIEIHEHNSQCNGNPVVSVTFTAAEDKCHSFGNPNEKKPGQWQGFHNGEQACEEQGFGEQECNAVGCCGWDSDHGQCHSDVGTAACSGSTWAVPACSPCTAYGTDNDGYTEEEGKMHYQQDEHGKCWSIE